MKTSDAVAPKGKPLLCEVRNRFAARVPTLETLTPFPAALRQDPSQPSTSRLPTPDSRLELPNALIEKVRERTAAMFDGWRRVFFGQT